MMELDKDTINILGTEYRIMTQTEEENRKLRNANAICEVYDKTIILNGSIQQDEDSYDNFDAFRRKVLRHELIHAFFAESGLRNNSDFAENEELVDWIAIQFPKIAKVFSELNILE